LNDLFSTTCVLLFYCCPPHIIESAEKFQNGACGYHSTVDVKLQTFLFFHQTYISEWYLSNWVKLFKGWIKETCFYIYTFFNMLQYWCATWLTVTCLTKSVGVRKLPWQRHNLKRKFAVTCLPKFNIYISMSLVLLFYSHVGNSNHKIEIIVWLEKCHMCSIVDRRLMVKNHLKFWLWPISPRIQG
jgi:hypothetical protein